MLRVVSLAVTFAAILTRDAAADELHRLSLADAVRIAIANDAELYIARVDAEVAANNVDLASSVFAPHLFGSISGTHDNQAPTAVSFNVLDKVLAGEIGLDGEVQTGATYKISGGLSRENLDSTYLTLYDPATTTIVSAEVVQPLRRGSFGSARQPIVVASLRRHQSEQQLRARLESSVGAVEAAYWNLVRARAEREARLGALSTAQQQVEEIKRLKRVGTGSELDITEAEAGASRREQELLVTEKDVVEADGKLFELLGVRIGKGWADGQMIEPTDGADTDLKTDVISLDKELELARTKRPDLLAAQSDTAAETAELDLADNQRLASINLVVRAATTGFSGHLANSDQTQGLNGTGLVPAYFTDPDYDGGLGQSLHNTLGKNLRAYVGLRFDLPFGNHEAEVKYKIQRQVVSRQKLEERLLLAKLESEVRSAVARVDVNIKLVKASVVAVSLSEKFLEGTQKRFRAGAGTTFDVLRASEDLTRAKVETARAQAQYHIALSGLATATGTLLETLNISVANLAGSPN